MKKILTILLLALAEASHAGSLTLAFDPSPSAATNVYYYILRSSTNSMVATNRAIVIVNLGTNTVVKLDNLVSGRLFFDARIVVGGVESGSSNELIVDVPAGPGATRIVVLQYSLSVKNEFKDAVFFRVKIGD